MSQVVLLLLILFGSAVALAAPVRAPIADVADAGQLAFRVYTDRDGIPQNAVRAIATDRNGHLWIGTKDGAAYYDGRAWTTIRLPEGRTTDVWAIAETPDGAVWIATDGSGLGRWRNGVWRVFDTASGLPSNQVRALDLDPAELVLWVGTDNGLARLALDGEGEVTDVRVETLGSGLGNAVTALCRAPAPDGAPALWVGLARGLVYGRDGRWTAARLPAELARLRVNGFASAPDDGVLDVATEDGLWEARGDLWRELRPQDVEAAFFVRCLTASGAGDARVVWAGTAGGGLYRFANERWTRFERANGLPDDLVWSLLVTPAPGGAGTLWVGTGGRGLARLSPNTWTSYDERNGLPGSSIYCFLDRRAPETPDETLWIGGGEGIARHRSGGWTVYATRDGNTRLFVLALAETRLPGGGSGLWVGTASGLYLFDDAGREVARYVEGSGIPDVVVMSLLETDAPEGGRELWVGTRRGLGRFHDGVWTRFPERGSGPNNEVTCLVETRGRDGERTLWAGAQRGLRRLRGGEWSTIDTSSGLPNGHVKCLHVSELADGSRRLWVGTNGGGACWRDLDDDASPWHTLSTTSDPALPNDVVYRVLEDAARNVYLTTNRGVARLAPAGSGYAVYVFTTDDGLPSNECNTGASYVDSRGRVWVGTIAGAAMLDPAARVEDAVAKPLRVRSEPHPLDGTLDLGYDESTLQFELTLVSFVHEAETRYRTQLVGLEAAPTDWTPDFTRRYTTLPAGSYTFRAWGRDYAGNVTGPVEVVIRVRAAPWATWWAYGLYAVALVGVGFGVQRLRVRRLQARARALDTVVDERTRQLAEANEALRVANLKERERALEAVTHAQQAELQMLRYQLNPHFLFNTLNAVRALVTKDPARGRAMITELAEFLRYSLTTSNAASVPLVQEIEAVRGYLAIQQIRFGDKLEVRFEVEPEAEEQPVPAFLLQPLVENAVKYGSLSGAKPLVVRVSVRRRNGSVRVWVSNTGRFLEAPNEAGGTGIGLDNVRQRLRETFGDAADFRLIARAGWVHARVRISGRSAADPRPQKAFH